MYFSIYGLEVNMKKSDIKLLANKNKEELKTLIGQISFEGFKKEALESPIGSTLREMLTHWEKARKEGLVSLQAKSNEFLREHYKSHYLNNKEYIKAVAGEISKLIKGKKNA